MQLYKVMSISALPPISWLLTPANCAFSAVQHQMNAIDVSLGPLYQDNVNSLVAKQFLLCTHLFSC